MAYMLVSMFKTNVQKMQKDWQETMGVLLVLLANDADVGKAAVKKCTENKLWKMK